MRVPALQRKGTRFVIRDIGLSARRGAPGRAVGKVLAMLDANVRALALASSLLPGVGLVCVRACHEYAGLEISVAHESITYRNDVLAHRMDDDADREIVLHDEVVLSSGRKCNSASGVVKEIFCVACVFWGTERISPALNCPVSISLQS